MPTRNVNLTAEQDAFIERMVATGRYQNASEAVRDAVRGLQQRCAEDELKLAALRAQIEASAEGGLKSLLSAAPLEGVDLERARDAGRRIDL